MYGQYSRVSYNGARTKIRMPLQKEFQLIVKHILCIYGFFLAVLDSTLMPFSVMKCPIARNLMYESMFFFFFYALQVLTRSGKCGGEGAMGSISSGISASIVTPGKPINVSLYYFFLVEEHSKAFDEKSQDVNFLWAKKLIF